MKELGYSIVIAVKIKSLLLGLSKVRLVAISGMNNLPS
jgi:hypothetical protein